MIKINRITNANVYVDGISFLGRVEECKLQDAKLMMSDHKALGLFGQVELPSGLDKMSATFKWNSLYPDVLGKVADPFTAVELQVRASMDVYANAGRIEQASVVAYLSGTFTNFPYGGFKQHENVEAETTMNVTYCKLEINGQAIQEIDVLANIYKAEGVDLLAAFRANIGG